MVTSCYIWMIVACVAVMCELGHPGLFFFLSLSVGAGVAAVASVYALSLGMQMALFLGGTLIALILCRIVCRQLEPHLVRTNMDALIGKSAIVIVEISFDVPGYVKVDGQKWLARSVHNKILTCGMQVRIVQVKGAHVVVEHI